MSTTNITAHQTVAETAQRTPDQPVYCVTLFVAHDTVVTANPTELRLGTITNGYVSIIVNPDSRDDNPETVFDTLDGFLHRCLAAVEQGRARHAIDQAAKNQVSLVDCPDCDGQGETYPGVDPTISGVCGRCGGEGEIPVPAGDGDDMAEEDIPVCGIVHAHGPDCYEVA